MTKPHRARMLIRVLACLPLLTAPTVESASSDKPRARALGVPFTGTPAALNAITDVTGVEVGQVTLIVGESGPVRVGSGPVRTGVTAILPRGKAKGNEPPDADIQTNSVTPSCRQSSRRH